MSDENIDKAKGRVNEASGALTGNRRLKHEVRADHAKRSAKDAVDMVADTLTGPKRTQR